MALVNTSVGDANLKLELDNKLFTQIARTDVPLWRGTHEAKFIKDIFTDFAAEASEMEGTVTVKSDAPLAAATLRTNEVPNSAFPQSVPALTTFPVLSGRADTAATGHFSTLLSGDVLVVVDTSSEKRPPLGAIYRVYAGDSLIAERVRGIDSPGSVTHLIPLSSAAKEWQISRVEVQPIQPGGSLGPRFDLRR